MIRKGNMILYGTQTGAAESLSDELQDEFRAVGLEHECENVFDFDVERFSQLKRVFIIISTWGEGEPPDDAEDFCSWLETLSKGSLVGLEFSIFGLGDSSFELFCECAKFVDRKLEESGATRILARVDCDTDIDEPFANWSELLLARLGKSAMQHC